MAQIKYEFGCDKKTEAFVKITPVITQEEVVYSIRRQSPKERPVKFYTGTTDMKDWIGTVRSIVNDNQTHECLLSVEGIYRGSKRILRNIKARDPQTVKIGERVMVTEHLNVAGGFDMIATKRRILDLKKPELNFINIGWSTTEECRFLRVDPYTGETKELLGNPIP
jgi:hypothetical protein